MTWQRYSNSASARAVLAVPLICNCPGSVQRCFLHGIVLSLELRCARVHMLPSHRSFCFQAPHVPTQHFGPPAVDKFQFHSLTRFPRCRLRYQHGSNSQNPLIQCAICKAEALPRVCDRELCFSNALLAGRDLSVPLKRIRFFAGLGRRFSEVECNQEAKEVWHIAPSPPSSAWRR